MKNQPETTVAQDRSYCKELAEADMDALIAQFGALRVAACEDGTGQVHEYLESLKWSDSDE